MDRGSPFVSELFKHVLTTLGSEHKLMTAYHPQTNATERVNRSLKTAIRAYVGNKHTAWECYLPQICFALRTAPHENTGDSPSMLLYGRELNTPLDIITQPNCDETDEPGIPYPESLIMLGPFGLEAMPKGRSIATRDVDLLLTLWMSW